MSPSAVPILVSNPLSPWVCYHNPTLSKSRINTAICALLAASATSVKSLRNGSVEADVPPVAGAGGTIFAVVGDCWVEERVEDWLLGVERFILVVVLFVGIMLGW